MATIRQFICEHDVIRLRRPVGRWPEGREGTVVSERGPLKLIEIADDQGQMLDLIEVEEVDLKLIAPHSSRGG